MKETNDFNIKCFACRNYTTKLTVEEVIKEYCARPNLRASTRIFRGHFFTRWLRKYYSMQILRFSNKEVNEIINDLDSHIVAHSKTPLSQNSKWSSLKEISSLFNFAEGRGYIPCNPFAGLKYKYIKKVARYLSRAEVVTLVSSNFPDDDFKVAVLLALCAGLRRGEVLGLKWQDVDLHNRTLTVKRSYMWLYGKGYYNSPKNRCERIVPLNDILYEALNEKVRVDEQVVHISPSRLTAGFPEYAERIGIHRYKFHDLRRTFGTIMLQEGVDLKTCSLLLGHKDITVTSDFYVAIIDEMSRRAVRTIDDIIDVKN